MTEPHMTKDVKSPVANIREYTTIISEIEAHTKALNELRKRRDILSDNIFEVMTQNGNANYTIKTKSGNYAFKKSTSFSGFNKEYFKTVFTKFFNGDTMKADSMISSLYANRTAKSRHVLTKLAD